MLLPYPLKTPPPSSSALRTDNPGKTCRQSSGLSFHAPLYLLLRAVTALIFSASSEYWAVLLLWFFVVLYLCLHCSAQLLLSFSFLPPPRPSQVYDVLKSINTNNLNYLTTYEPTYWPTDTNKIPDLLDFFITKNISPRYVQINSSAELSSDHSPVIATVSSAIIENPPNGLIHNQRTNWQLFREVFNHSTSASISLKTKEDIETATEYLNTSIINAIRSSTPTKTSISKHEYPHYVLNKITEKRRLRRVWQTHRTPDDKRKLNNATRKLTKIIKKYKNDCFQKYLVNLSPSADFNYSLWKASRKLTCPPQIIPPIRYPQGGWARSPIEKANLFANYLSNI